MFEGESPAWACYFMPQRCGHVRYRKLHPVTGWLAGLFAGQTRQHKSALGVDVIRKTGTRS
jgi:hypothetical protein